MKTTEKRFTDGIGERYMSDGKRIRCQAVAKNQVRQWREEHNDTETPIEELFPECQCGREAVIGQYVCRWHGGQSPRRVNPPRTIIDTMPAEFAEKFRVIAEDPDYISRRDDILLMKTRQWELLEELSQQVGSEEAWASIHEGIRNIKRGEIIAGTRMIEEALDSYSAKDKVWREIRQVENVLKDLTNTQVKTAKELQSMATTEQITALITNILSAISHESLIIDDPNTRNQFLQSLSQHIAKFIGLRSPVVIEAVTAGSRENNRTTE